MRDKLRKIGALVSLVRLSRALREQFGWNIAAMIPAMARFLADFRRFKGMEPNPVMRADIGNVLPYLRDRTSTTPLDPVYFFQDAWAAGRIFARKPRRHVDVGSSAKTIGILSQFVPVTMVDIRPVELELPNLSFQQGSILALPFPDDSIDSLSSLCVVEHIGLGRYGDDLDPLGSEKAMRELIRVLKPGGRLYFSVPVDDENRVYFNAHRAFRREYVLTCFESCRLIIERYVYGTRMTDRYDPARGFGTGLYEFTKNRKRKR